MNTRRLKTHFGSEISLEQDVWRPGNESSLMEFETQKLLNLQNEGLKRRQSGSVQMGQDQSDLNQVGDLEIIVWNKHKTKQLITFKCRQNSLNLNKCDAMENKKSADNAEHLQNFEKIISKISLQILEDQLGKPNYRFSLDTLGTSLISQMSNGGVKQLHWKGGEGAFDMEMRIDSQGPKHSALPPCFKKVSRVRSEIVRNQNQLQKFRYEIDKCSGQQRLKGEFRRVLEYILYCGFYFPAK